MTPLQALAEVERDPATLRGAAQEAIRQARSPWLATAVALD